jgi:predicted branched-subunit amino acid permease
VAIRSLPSAPAAASPVLWTRPASVEAAPGAWADGRAGVLAMLPLLVAYAPFALVIGATAAEQGAPLAGWAGSWLIYGGSAHLAALRTLHGAGPWAAILTGLVIHTRLLVYSAGLARTWRHQPRWFRVAAAGMVIDPTFALAERHAGVVADPARQRRYFFGAALTLGLGWSSAMAVGALVGARFEGPGLQIVVPLCLLGLIGQGLRAPATRAVLGAAAVVALLTANWPAGTGLLAAIAAGCAVGAVVEGRSR